MKIISFFVLAMILSVPAFAQSSIRNEFDKRIDALSAPVSDIDARYWASRVQSGSVTIEKLEENSKNWLGSDKAQKKQIAKIKKYLKSGKKISITESEKAQLDESKLKIKKFLETPEADLKQQRNAKIDAIMAPVRDIEARELALKVKNNQITFEKLEEFSKGWLGSAEENKAVIERAKKYVSDGKKISITPEEFRKLDESNKKIQTFLNDGKKTSVASKAEYRNSKVLKIQKPVFELEARYWANRVAEKKDVTFEELSKSSLNWIGSREYNQKLINKIEENIKKGNTKKLTDKEQKKLDEANEKISQLMK